MEDEGKEILVYSVALCWLCRASNAMHHNGSAFVAFLQIYDHLSRHLRSQNAIP